MIADLAHHLRAVAALAPDDPMLEFEHRWWTWRDLTTWMAGIDDALTAHGLESGHAIGIVLSNRAESVGALAAVLGSDRCIVTLNPAQPDSKLADEIAALALGAVVIGGRDLERTEVVDRARQAGVVIELRGTELISSGAAPNDPPRRPEVAVEMLTSGTTGPPKRIPLSYDRLVRSVGARVTEGPELREGTKIVWAPMAHIGGVWGVTSTLVEGRRLCLLARFEVSDWVERVRDHRPKVTGLPPTGMRMLLDADLDTADLSSLSAVIVGTAPASAGLIEEFETTFGIPALITYGATEFAGAVACWTLDLHRRFGAAKRGAVGRAMPGVELRVTQPDTSEVLAANESGLLEIRSQALATEWVRTSDRAHLDDDGFLFIEGRADDAIIRGGFKVSAGKVAAALEELSEVRRAGVVSMADERLGEVPVAAIEANVDEVDPEHLLDVLRRQLSPYEVPVTLVVVDHLPMTPTLKVDAVALRALLAHVAERADETRRP